MSEERTKDLSASSCSVSISSEAVEAACDKLDDEIASCDGGEKLQEERLQEARDFLWSFHFTQNVKAQTSPTESDL